VLFHFIIFYTKCCDILEPNQRVWGVLRMCSFPTLAVPPSRSLSVVFCTDWTTLCSHNF
jgi:hypothetical protein